MNINKHKLRKYLFKPALYVVGISIGLDLILSLILYFFVNPNHYKHLITNKLQQATGHQVSLNGKIHWKFFPSLGVEATNIDIAPNQLLHIKSVTLNIALLPLLTKKLVIDKLIIDGASLSLIKSANGNNWSVKTKNSVSNYSTTPNRQPSSMNQPSSTSLSFLPRYLEISNFNFNYNNTITSKHYSLNNISLDVEQSNNYILANPNDITINYIDLKIGKVFDLSGSANLKNLFRDSSKLHYTVKLSTKDFALNPLFKAFNISPVKVNHDELINKITIKSELDGGIDNLAVRNLDVLLNKTRITGDIVINSFTPSNINDQLLITDLDLSDIKSFNGFALNIKQTNISGQIHGPSLADSINIKNNYMVQNIQATHLKLLGFSIDNFIRGFNDTFSPSLSTLANSITLRPLEPIKQSLAPLTTDGKKNYSYQSMFNRLTTKVIADQGNITTQNMQMIGPSANVNGSGVVNLNDNNLNYLLNLHFKSQVGNLMIDYLHFPLHAYGNFGNIETQIDWSSVLSQVIKYQTNHADNLKNKIGHAVEYIQKGTENIFNKIFK